MTATEPRPEPAQPADGGAKASEPARASEPAAAAPVVRGVRPEQAREDTDAAWGEYPDWNDERLYRDRPPHWADF